MMLVGDMTGVAGMMVVAGMAEEGDHGPA